MIKRTETAILRIQRGCFSGIPPSLWEDDEVHKAVAELAGAHPSWVAKYLPKYLPDELFDRYLDIFIPSVRYNGGLMRRIPEEMLSESICMSAVAANGGAIKFVPERYKTKKLCMAAVKSEYAGWEAVAYFPDSLLDEGTLMEILEETEGRAFRHIPKEERSPALCRRAIELAGENLAFIPTDLRTEEICLEAVKRDKYAFRNVPQKFRTKEFCTRLAQANTEVIEIMPERCLSEEALYNAVRQDREFIKYVPEKLLVKAFLFYEKANT